MSFLSLFIAGCTARHQFCIAFATQGYNCTTFLVGSSLPPPALTNQKEAAAKSSSVMQLWQLLMTNAVLTQRLIRNALNACKSAATSTMRIEAATYLPSVSKMPAVRRRTEQEPDVGCYKDDDFSN